MSSDWLADGTANRHIKTYTKDFVDISGNVKIRHGGLDIIDGSLNITNKMFVGTNNRGTTERLHVASESPVLRINATSDNAKLQLLKTGLDSEGNSATDLPTNGLEIEYNGSDRKTYLGRYLDNPSITQQMTFTQDDYIGIGATDPSYQLDVNGGCRVGLLNINNSLTLGSFPFPSNTWMKTADTDQQIRLYLSSGHALYYRSLDNVFFSVDSDAGASTKYIRCDQSRNVGIGKGAGTKLDVNGSFRANYQLAGQHYIGKAMVGQIGGGATNHMYFAHYDRRSTSSAYALQQDDGGSTTLNTGDTFGLRANNREFINISEGSDTQYWMWNGFQRDASSYYRRWRWRFNSNNNWDFDYGAGSLGSVAYLNAGADEAQIDFTGQHRVFIENIPYSHAEKYIGLIACANKNDYMDIDEAIKRGIDAMSINQALPYTSLCRKEQDKTCFGVISGSEDDVGEDSENKYRVFSLGCLGTKTRKQHGDYRYYINSVGEGAMWVCNKKGSLESGDYITSASVTGYGQKQDEVMVCNYTVAKITMDCDFNPVLQYKKKIKRVPVELTRDSSGNYFDASNNMVYGIDPDSTGRDSTGPSDESNQDESGAPSYDMKLMDDIYNITVDEESKTITEITQNVLDAYGELQWEDSEEQEYPYKIRYVDVDGNILTQEEYNNKKVAGEEVYIAALVGVTYHCG
jgi:hypothetical protein